MEKIKKKIQYSGHNVSQPEIDAVKEVMESGWIGKGAKSVAFESKISKMLGKEDGVFVNSGSSANLLAVTAMKKYYNMKDGDEVIVSGVNFPTTINCIIQNNLVPVFVDVELRHYNIDVDLIEDSISENTTAIMVVHTLGNPCNMERIMSIANKHGLIVIEDCCDALTSKYDEQPVGSFGDFATTSFYPSHLISTGGGGMVCGRNEEINKLLRSLAEWGRACHCFGAGGMTENGLCGERFSNWLPIDDVYDHKYVYDNIGYCLINNDISAAIGLEQLKMIGYMKDRRTYHFYDFLDFFGVEYNDTFVLPSSYCIAEPTWFAFPLTIRPEAGFKRSELVKHLEDYNIQTRPIFGGNLLLHPLYKKSKCRVPNKLEVSNLITESSFFIGVWESTTKQEIEYTKDVFREFLK